MDNQVKALNVSKLFTKEILLYSLMDIHFSTPRRLSQLLYFLILAGIFGFVTFKITFPPNVYSVSFVLGVPWGLSNIMSKPIWGGKSFLQWAKTQILFILSPKRFYDTRVMPKLESYKINNEYTVSRREDFKKLLELERKSYGKSV